MAIRSESMAKLNPSFWVISITLLSIQFKGSLASQSTNEAYVTLLYGDEFLLGVRVLGKSIRDTGSHKDMVVLVSDGVSDYSKKLLMVINLSITGKLKKKLKVKIFPFLDIDFDFFGGLCRLMGGK